MITRTLENAPLHYGALVGDRGFRSFLVTQFLGAFNDNIFKMLLAGLALQLPVAESGRLLFLVSVVFVAPFLLFAGYAGQVADRFAKSSVLRWTKLWEVGVMGLATVALMSGRMEAMLLVLFLLACQANFFSPAKYGILNEIVPATHLPLANGLLELSTFVAIVCGGALGVGAAKLAHVHPGMLGLGMVALAVMGYATSLRIPRTEAQRAEVPFRWNPFVEVMAGNRILREHAGLRWAVVGNTFFWFLGALCQNLLLLFAKDALGLPEDMAGAMTAILALGIGAGSMLAGRLSGVGIEFGWTGFGAMLLGVCAAALFPVTSIGGAAVLLVGMGVGGGAFAIPVNAYLQHKAPKQFQGAVQAVNNFWNMIGVCVAGALLKGGVEAGFDARRMVLGVGVSCVVVGLGLVVKLKAAHVRLAVMTLVRVVFRYRVVGTMPSEGAVLVAANHVSWLDAIVLGMASGRTPRFLMWQRMYEVRWIKPVADWFGAIPLPIEHPRQALEALQAARQELMQGGCVGIFPEGEITRTGQTMPFESGYQRVLRGTRAVVVPVYIHGLHGHGCAPKETRREGWWKRGRWAVTLYVGEPMTGVPAAEELRERVLELEAEAMRIAAEERTLTGELVRAARSNWSREAMSDTNGNRLTYGELLTAAVAMSGFVKGEAERVGVLLPASCGGAIANLAIAMAGKTSVNLNFTAGVEHMRHVEEVCGLEQIVTSRVFVEKVGMAVTERMVFLEDWKGALTLREKLVALLRARLGRCSVKGNGVATILYSSGSTGTPKGVMLSEANLIANCDATARIYPLRGDDGMFGALPFFHSFGYVYTLWFPLLQELRVGYHSNPMEAKKVGEVIAAKKLTFLMTTPTFAQGYLRRVEAEQLASLRYVLVGAEKLRPQLAEEFEQKFGVAMQEGYGCTEMSPVVAVNTLDREGQVARRVGSVGRPVPGCVVKIVDPETGASVAVGQEGLLLAGGAGRMLGYWRDPARTRESLREGLYVTGDIARMDAEGFVTITDRLARFSKIGGEMVSHLRVEEAVRSVLGDERCHVTGIPDEAKGERLVVLYVSEEERSEEIAKGLKALGLPALWTPKRQDCVRVEAIPALGTGKTDLHGAREMARKLVEVCV